ncbi:MAG: efflux RND transporter permease subunit, partial [Planctomycetaceae bacterium]|nr:efflux RND transporter permease subunit [Planctomycetaceae bacterium]
MFRFPIVGLLLGLVLPIIGFRSAMNLPEQFFPASDRRQIQIEVELDARATIEKTQETVTKLQEIVFQSREVDRQYWFIGQSAPTFFYNVVPRRRGTPFYAQAFLELNERSETQRIVRHLQGQLDQQVPEARILVRQLAQGPPFDAPIEVRVNGPDLVTLQKLGSDLRSLLSKTSDVIHTRSDLEETIPRLSLTVNHDAAEKAGVDRSKLAGLIYTTLEGAPAGTVFDGADELPVRIKIPFDGEYQQERLAALPLPRGNQSQADMFQPDGTEAEEVSTPDLNPITLGTLTTFEISSDVGAIVRINSNRVNEVKAYIRAGVLPSQVMSEFQSKLENSAFTLPDGYEIRFGGETEQRSQAVDQLIANGAVLFSLMLLTLVASFQSFRCAFIIACVGALSAGLGPLALSWFGFPFGFMAIVGTMGLVGVAINDSIVVLAAIRANDAARSGDRTDLVRVVSGC